MISQRKKKKAREPLNPLSNLPTFLQSAISRSIYFTTPTPWRQLWIPATASGNPCLSVPDATQLAYPIYLAPSRQVCSAWPSAQTHAATSTAPPARTLTVSAPNPKPTSSDCKCKNYLRDFTWRTATLSWGKQWRTYSFGMSACILISQKVTLTSWLAERGFVDRVSWSWRARCWRLGVRSGSRLRCKRRV